MPNCPACERYITGDTDMCRYCGAELSPAETLPAETLQQADLARRVLDLLVRGNKIAAVKLYKDETGASLADSKRAVENIEAGEVQRFAGEPIGEDWHADVLVLLSEGNKIEAIRLYRERARVSLKEAKEAVENLGRQFGVESSSKGGCFGAMLLVAGLLIAGICGAGVWLA